MPWLARSEAAALYYYLLIFASESHPKGFGITSKRDVCMRIKKKKKLNVFAICSE